MRQARLKVRSNSLLRALHQTWETIGIQKTQTLLQNYMITGSQEKQTLILFSTNLKLAGIGVCPARISDDFQILIPGMKLIKLVDLMERDIILDITIDDQKMVIKAGNFTCKLQGMTPDKFPPIPDLDGLEFASISRKLLASHLHRIYSRICVNSRRKHLAKVHIGGGSMLGFNGQIAIICKCSFSGRIDELTIPGGVVRSLISLIDRVEATDVQITKTDDFIVFKIGQTCFFAHKPNAKLPDLVDAKTRYTPNIESIASFDKTDLKTAVQRVSITCNRDTLGVSIKFFKDCLSISSCDHKGNRSREISSCTWNGREGVEYCFNHMYLLNILKTLSADLVYLRISEDKRLPVSFHDGDLIVFLKSQVL